MPLDRYQAWGLQRGATPMDRPGTPQGALRSPVRPHDGGEYPHERVASGTLDPGLLVDALKVAVSAGEWTARSTLPSWIARVAAGRAALCRLRAVVPGRAGNRRWAAPEGAGPAHANDSLRTRARMGARPAPRTGARPPPRRRVAAGPPGVPENARLSGRVFRPEAPAAGADWPARALPAGGQVAQSRAAYQRFLTLWTPADPDLPLLAAARTDWPRCGRDTRPTPHVPRP